MPLHENNELLKSTLEAMPLFEDRYQNWTLKNYASAQAAKRGSYSMVFKAF